MDKGDRCETAMRSGHRGAQSGPIPRGNESNGPTGVFSIVENEGPIGDEWGCAPEGTEAKQRDDDMQEKE